jgi:hypothetical protein
MGLIGPGAETEMRANGSGIMPTGRPIWQVGGMADSEVAGCIGMQAEGPGSGRTCGSACGLSERLPLHRPPALTSLAGLG